MKMESLLFSQRREVMAILKVAGNFLAAKVVIDEQNFAHRGKMRQIVPERGSRDIPFVYVSGQE